MKLNKQQTKLLGTATAAMVQAQNTLEFVEKQFNDRNDEYLRDKELADPSTDTLLPDMTWSHFYTSRDEAQKTYDLCVQVVEDLIESFR